MGIPKNLPKILFSESDLTEVYNQDVGIKKTYDFIYNCQKGHHQRIWRNWDLGIKCIDIMVNKYNLKIVLVGKKGDTYENSNEKEILSHPNVTMTNFLKRFELMLYMNKTKSIFLPNIYDASPRISAEALNMDLSILENRNIIGGWKYVNKDTGMDFNGIEDFEEVLQQF